MLDVCNSDRFVLSSLIENVSGGAPTSSGDSELDIIIPQPRRTFPQFQDRRFEGFDEYVDQLVGDSSQNFCQ